VALMIADAIKSSSRDTFRDGRRDSRDEDRWHIFFSPFLPQAPGAHMQLGLASWIFRWRREFVFAPVDLVSR
jgi:hypothetical protein